MPYLWGGNGGDGNGSKEEKKESESKGGGGGGSNHESASPPMPQMVGIVVFLIFQYSDPTLPQRRSRSQPLWRWTGVVGGGDG